MTDLQRYFDRVPFNTDVKFTKQQLSHLPSCFKKTLLGEPRLGMIGQYRCGNLHAYEFGSHWLIHKDRRNPETHPVEHLIEDAPHWLAIGMTIVAGLGVAAWNYLTQEDEVA